MESALIVDAVLTNTGDDGLEILIILKIPGVSPTTYKYLPLTVSFCVWSAPKLKVLISCGAEWRLTSTILRIPFDWM